MDTSPFIVTPLPAFIVATFSVELPVPNMTEPLGPLELSVTPPEIWDVSTPST